MASKSDSDTDDFSPSIFNKALKYDDQGLYFSIVLCLVLTLIFTPLTIFLLRKPPLWLKRLYRPNHTQEPQAEAASSRSTHLLDGHAQERRGISLPYHTTLFQIPSWRDLISVEEYLPHLESALAIPDTSKTEDPNTLDGTTPPKTPLSPQVALYIFTLKYFAALMFASVFFTVWICVISDQENNAHQHAMEVRLAKCHLYNNNKTACELKWPFCTYDNTTVCSSVLLKGLYDLSVKNLFPGSWRWWPVTLLNCCFCVAVVLLTLYFLSVVGRYVDQVMYNQIQCALGYRVVCVRGLDKNVNSAKSFMSRYLAEQTYFPTRKKGGGHQAFDRCTNIDFSGFKSLFGISYCHYYTTYRSDATFTQPGKVMQILFSLCAPAGMYSLLHKTEGDMIAMEEAIAHERALQRKQRHHEELSILKTHNTVGLPQMQRTFFSRIFSLRKRISGALVSSPSDNRTGGKKSFLAKIRFPRCCYRTRSVSFYESRFRCHAESLNEYIRGLSRQKLDSAVFVIFSDSRAAFEFVNLFNARHKWFWSSAMADIAGPPKKIIADNLQSHRGVLILRFILVTCAYVFFLFTYSIPVSFVGSLRNLAYIPKLGNFILNFYHKNISESMQVIIEAYLSVGMLALFNVFLPNIIHFFVLLMGAFNKREVEGGQLFLQSLFMVLTGVIFQSALQGGFKQLALFFNANDMHSLKEFFIDCVSASHGNYYFAKVLIATGLTAWIDIIDPFTLIKTYLLRKRVLHQRAYDALYTHCPLYLAEHYSFDLMILSIGFLFHMTVPLLGIFACLYFVVSYMLQRVRLYDRYRPFLPAAHDCTDFGISAQIIRCVVCLFCLSEGGGVLLLTLQKHTGGLVLCYMTFITGIILLIYVYHVTQRWIVVLARVREFAQRAPDFPASSPIVLAPEPGTQKPAGAAEVAQTPSAEKTEGGGDPQDQGPFVDQPFREGADKTDALNYENPQFVTFESSQRLKLAKKHLWPRIHLTSYLYVPKHQCLAVMDIPATIKKMRCKNFSLMRYWDCDSTQVESNDPVEKNFVEEVHPWSNKEEIESDSSYKKSICTSEVPHNLIESHTREEAEARQQQV